ncbi:unnamed protein product [Rotaria socialis]|uniref:Uncharacterized protein n=2 Tax=Rotaria socialis TaxID=392032 RepID=A0A818A1J5_9BILA|nr:unnamed protein product [Rotaria socialis]
MPANTFDHENINTIGIAAHDSVLVETSELDAALTSEKHPLQRSPSNNSSNTVIIFLGESKSAVENLDENNQLSAEKQQQSDR